MTFAQNLEYLRKYNNLTIAEAAEKIGASAKSIKSWEAGKSKPLAKFIKPMAIAYNVDINTVILYKNKFLDVDLSDLSEKDEYLIRDLLMALIRLPDADDTSTVLDRILNSFDREEDVEDIEAND